MDWDVLMYNFKAATNLNEEQIKQIVQQLPLGYEAVYRFYLLVGRFPTYKEAAAISLCSLDMYMSIMQPLPIVF